MNTIIFSIIIPAKNEEANIGICIDSINSIDYDSTQYEIILIDNGSTDRTVEIAHSKGAKVYIEPGLTISGLRNFGANNASGNILAFIDADCTVDRSWLKIASTYVNQNEIVCFGSPPAIPENGTWVQKAWFEIRKKKIPVGETNWLESMNMFIRKDAFIKCNGFDERLITCEDYDISIRLKSIGKFYTDSKIVAFHHGEASTISHFYRKEVWRGISNFKGFSQHGFRLSELPSIIIPTFHCFLFFIFFIALIFNLINAATTLFYYVAALFLLWQISLLVSIILKFNKISAFVMVQIYILLNIYYVARGVAPLKK